MSYANGPVYVGVGYEVSNDGSKDENWGSLAATYDFGVVKLYAGYGDGQDAAKVKRKNAIFGITAPVGPGSVIASYDLQNQAGVRVEQLLSVGYKYFLSKRTSVYGNVSFALGDLKDFVNEKQFYQLGLRHSF